MGKFTGTSIMVLSLTGTFLASYATAKHRPSKNNRPKLITVDAREETFGCPVGWKSEVHPIAWLAANCYLNQTWFTKDKPSRWAHAQLERLDYSMYSQGPYKQHCEDHSARYCYDSLKQLLQDKQQCLSGGGSKAYGWCGKFIGTIKVAGSEGAIIQSAPNAEQPNIKMLEVIFPVGGSKEYTIEIAAPKEQFDDFMPYFDAIIASFRAR